jgi:glycosyltransferase involved in cell wall biosynthesis
MSTLVSVLIPCYNAETFVEMAVRSVMEQTYQNLEIICIDDCSTDSTLKILQKLAQEDPRIRIEHNTENLKLIKTLNKGIELAKGEYIARMDADDRCKPRRIERQIQEIQKDATIDLVGIVPNFISHEGHKIGYAPGLDMHSNGPLRFVTLFNCPVVHPTVLCKAEVMKQYHYADHVEALHIEDYELWSRMLFDSKRFVVLKEDLFEYRLSQKGISRSSRIEQANRHIHLSSCILQKHLDYKMPVTAIGIISKNTFPLSQQDLKTALVELEKTKYQFYSKNLSLSQQEKWEIEEWCDQRVLFILFNAIKKANTRVKLTAISLLPTYFGVCFSVKTYQNIISRINVIWYKNK